MDLLNDYGFSDDNGYAVETVTYVVDMHALASQQFTEKQATSFVVLRATLRPRFQGSVAEFSVHFLPVNKPLPLIRLRQPANVVNRIFVKSWNYS